MARIPTTSTKRRALPSNTRSMSNIDFNAVNAPARARAELGRAISQTGEVIFNKLEEQKREKDRFDLAEARNKYLEERLKLEREIPEGLSREEWGDTYRTRLKEIEKEIASTLSEDNQKEFAVSAENEAIRGGHQLRSRATREAKSEAEQAKTRTERVAVATAKNKFLRERLKLQNKYSDFDGDPEEWANQFESELSVLRDQITETVPDEYRDAFIAETDNDLIRTSAVINNKADTQILKDARGALAVDIDESIDLAIGTDNSSDRIQILESVNEQINVALENRVIDVEEAHKLRKTATQNYAKRRAEMLSAEQQSFVFDPGKYGDNIDVEADFVMHKLEAAWGSSFNITSGYRSPEHNKKVGGADGSQHLHGKAFDIDVSNMSIGERKRLIALARKSGFGGVGVYNNSLHFDVGPTRAWGPSYSSDDIPDWAKDVVGVSRGSVDAPSYADTQLTRYLEADQVLAYKESSQNDYQRELDTQQSMYMDGFDDLVSSIRMGADVSEGMMDQYSSENILANVFDDKQRVLMEESLKSAVQFSTYMDELKSMSIEQIQNATDQFAVRDVTNKADAVLAQQEAADLSNWQSAVVTTLKNRVEDPGGYSMSIDPNNSFPEEGSEVPDYTTYAARTLATQSSLGLPDHQQKILPKTMAAEQVRQFMSMEPDAMGVAMNNYYNLWGDHGDQVMQELSETGDLPEGVAVGLRYADDPALVAEVMSMAKIPTSELEKSLPEDTPAVDVKNDLNSELNEYMQVFETGDITGRATTVFNQNRDLAYKLALRYTREGHSDPVGKAVEKLFPEGVVNQGQQKYLLPSEFKNMAPSIETRLDNLLDVDVLREAGALPLDNPMMVGFEDEAVSFSSLASTGVWLTNSTGDGVVLSYNSDGMYFPVYRGSSDNPQMFEIKFKDIPELRISKFGYYPGMDASDGVWYPWKETE